MSFEVRDNALSYITKATFQDDVIADFPRLVPLK